MIDYIKPIFDLMNRLEITGMIVKKTFHNIFEQFGITLNGLYKDDYDDPISSNTHYE